MSEPGYLRARTSDGVVHDANRIGTQDMAYTYCGVVLMAKDCVDHRRYNLFDVVHDDAPTCLECAPVPSIERSIWYAHRQE